MIYVAHNVRLMESAERGGFVGELFEYGKMNIALLDDKGKKIKPPAADEEHPVMFRIGHRMPHTIGFYFDAVTGKISRFGEGPRNPTDSYAVANINYDRKAGKFGLGDILYENEPSLTAREVIDSSVEDFNKTRVRKDQVAKRK